MANVRRLNSLTLPFVRELTAKRDAAGEHAEREVQLESRARVLWAFDEPLSNIGVHLLAQARRGGIPLMTMFKVAALEAKTSAVGIMGMQGLGVLEGTGRADGVGFPEMPRDPFHSREEIAGCLADVALNARPYDTRFREIAVHIVGRMPAEHRVYRQTMLVQALLTWRDRSFHPLLLSQLSHEDLSDPLIAGALQERPELAAQLERRRGFSGRSGFGDLERRRP